MSMINAARAGSREFTSPLLQGVYAPVMEERWIEDLPVHGTLPDAFQGTFYRNGPNPQFPAPGKYHVFDGDGMIHAFHFRDGKVSYVNKWVRTEKWRREHRAGRGLFGGVADPGASDPLVRDLPVSARNTAGTHVFWHHGRCLAMCERGMPWEVHPITLETIGLEDYDGQLVGKNYTAHPHIDGANGDLLFFGYGISPDMPEMSAYIADKDNNLKMNLTLPSPYRCMAHDSIFTTDYFIIPYFPATIDFERVKQGQSYLQWEPDRGSHLAFLPRNATSADEAIWISMEAAYVFHFYNAFQDGDRIIMDAAVFDRPPIIPGDTTKKTGAVLERWTVDMPKRSIKRVRLDDRYADFPRIDERLQGSAYTMGIAVGPDQTKDIGDFDGLRYLHRYDMATGARKTHDFGTNMTTSEAVFVPTSADGAKEEGYILSLVDIADENRSILYILAADDVEGEPVATVDIPVRVPRGFHSQWRSDVDGYPYKGAAVTA